MRICGKYIGFRRLRHIFSSEYASYYCLAARRHLLNQVLKNILRHCLLCLRNSSADGIIRDKFIIFIVIIYPVLYLILNCLDRI
jgi:hypothetical protein